MGRGGGTYGAGVAGEVVGLLELGEDDDGRAGGLEARAERGVAEDGRGERAAEGGGDEQVRRRLDGGRGGLVQCGGLFAPERREGRVVDWRCVL